MSTFRMPFDQIRHLLREQGSVELDGTPIGSIGHGETVEVPVEPGHHTVRLRSQRHSSPERSFDAADGQMVSFSCRAAVFWPQYVAALIKPDLWISLKQE